ncbi:MAG TPA: flagellar hook protein FlgE [Clostridia bacterium]|nr:flagellar hook protein FlgE [Clostridia bacterium]
MPLFSIPLSGLTASSTALSAIANNLANLNTVGYKQTRATFRDLFYQSIGSSGSGNPIQIGAGAAVGSLSTVFYGGNVESTGVPTDVAIMGDGFFVVEKDGARQFTRAGNFKTGPDGWLMTDDGQLVMGYPASNGAVSSGTAIGPLQVGKGIVSPPSATTTMKLQANLDAGAAVGEKFSTPMTVYDSLGAEHALTFQFTKTDANEWNYSVLIPAADTGATGNPVQLASGTLTFDSNGRLTTPAADVTGIAITGLANGAGDLSLTWRIFGDNGASFLTQRASPSNASLPEQDGCESGTLSDFSIGNDGVIQGAFSNGKGMVLGQVALASFANMQGLTRMGRNCFSPTLASGEPSIGAPGTGGRGTLAGGALEPSNVDIAQEFAQMILAQRGFQANARAITTFDELAQETINLKR